MQCEAGKLFEHDTKHTREGGSPQLLSWRYARATRVPGNW